MPKNQKKMKDKIRVTKAYLGSDGVRFCSWLAGLPPLTTAAPACFTTPGTHRNENYLVTAWMAALT